MKRILLLTLKIFGGIVIFLLVLLIGGAVALNNSSVIGSSFIRNI